MANGLRGWVTLFAVSRRRLDIFLYTNFIPSGTINRSSIRDLSKEESDGGVPRPRGRRRNLGFEDRLLCINGEKAGFLPGKGRAGGDVRGDRPRVRDQGHSRVESRVTGGGNGDGTMGRTVRLDFGTLRVRG
jgi:hypothetical protein